MQEQEQEVTAPEADQPVAFNVWFSRLIELNKKVKANHMGAIKAHCNKLGCGDVAPQSQYEKALKHYGI